jgi:pyrrolidone-carboxylate peptidase
MQRQRLLYGLIAAGISVSATTQAACFDESITPAFEEQRLPLALPGTTEPVSQRLLKGSGLDKLVDKFVGKLCAADAPTSLEEATGMANAEGRKLWRAAVDRAQGKHVEGDLPRSDDRPLYWARLSMRKALRQWQPSFAMASEERTKLIWEFERHSRGQYDISFPAGPQQKRILVSGFDPFSLSNALLVPSTGLRIGNPSGANALSLDGQRLTLADGTRIAVETYVLPVNYTEFDLGMVEDTVAPHMQPGPKRVDASISVSQGGAFEFWLEHWNGRFHGPSAGNDGIATCPQGAARLPTHPGCNVYPPQRWLGHDPKPWVKNSPPQFTVSSMPMASMINAKTGTPGGAFQRPPGDGWNNPNDPAEVFGVFWHTNYGIFVDRNCALTQTMNRNTPVPLAFPPPTLPIPPHAEECARSGGGGDYLSNEVAYRNTLMRDTFGLKIPAGHIHVPTMTRFIGNTPPNNSSSSNPLAITDSTFEAYRDAIVEQTRRLIFVAAQNLNEGVPPVGMPPN